MPLTVSLTPPQVAVEPGQSGSFTLELAGDAQNVRFELRGPAAEWALVVPSAVSVPAGGGTVPARVVVQVPRSPRVAAGPSSITVRAAGAEASATVDVLPFVELRASLSPRVSRGRVGGPHTLHVENLGNRAVDVAVVTDGVDGGLQVHPDRTSLALGAGEAVAVPVRVEARGRRLVGASRSRPLRVTVRAGDTAAATEGLLVQERVRWTLPVVLAGGLAALVAVLALRGEGGGRSAPVAVPTTLGGAVPAQTATCPPEVAEPGGDLLVQNFLFCPVSVTVVAGSELRWSNRDQAPHTVTADGDAFDTGGFGRGEVRSVRFDRPGTFHYFCRLHPFMRGTVVVA